MSAATSKTRSTIEHIIGRLSHATKLASNQVEEEPEMAARYLLNTVDDLNRSFALLRNALKRPPSS